MWFKTYRATPVPLKPIKTYNVFVYTFGYKNGRCFTAWGYNIKNLKDRYELISIDGKRNRATIYKQDLDWMTKKLEKKPVVDNTDH